MQALKELPAKLGLGRYLVTDDRKRRKLDAADSTRFDDHVRHAARGGVKLVDALAALKSRQKLADFFFFVWTEGTRRIQTVTFQPIKGKNSIYVPAGGISWIDAGVMDRTATNQLASHPSPRLRAYVPKAVVLNAVAGIPSIVFCGASAASG